MKKISTEPNKGKAERRYQMMESKRSAYLLRAQKCSKLSIPSLIPEGGKEGGGVSFNTPYQSLAARGVNNLASKLMLSLLPPNAPFFKLKIDISKLNEEERQDEEMKLEMDKGLSKIERAVIEEIASTSDRVVLFEALKHLIVGGNALLYVDPKGGMKCFHLDGYVVRRDGRGEVREIVVKETVDILSLPESTASILRKSESKSGNEKVGNEAGKTAKAEYALYTHIQRETGKWTVLQEVQGIVVDGSYGTYPLDASPWIAMRLLRVDGEDYGRSYVEEYYGDIASLDGLSQAIVEGSAAAAKILFLIHPNATTRDTDLAQAPNLGFVSGSRSDVDVLQLDKYADFRVARETIVGIEQRLEHAFILNSAFQRNGERVTREEIRKMAEDLEAALGGVYSLLAVEFQTPYIACKLKQLTKQRKIPPMPKGIVKPVIVTGVEAIGRGNDKEKLVEMLETAQRILGPSVAQVLNVENIVIRLCTALGIDSEGLFIPQEEKAAQQEQAQTQENVKALGPDAMKLFGQAMQNPEMMQQMQGVMP